MKDVYPTARLEASGLKEAFEDNMTSSKGIRAGLRNSGGPFICLKRTGGEVRYFDTKDEQAGRLATYIEANSREVLEVVVTDDVSDLGGVQHGTGIGKKKSNKKVTHSRSCDSNQVSAKRTASPFCRLKRANTESRSKVSAKHLAVYLDEMTLRLNNRSNPYLFRDVLQKLVQSQELKYEMLTAV